MTEFGVAALSGNPRDVREYLTRAVLNRQPAHVRAILLDTCVLDRLSKDVCDAIQEVVHNQVRSGRPDRWPLVRREPDLKLAVEPLTEREMEVLHLMARGMCNQRIAEHLVVVVDTVKKHVSHVLRKLNADNRTEAVARARVLGLLN